MSEKSYSVCQIVRIIKNKIENDSDLRNFLVCGEISKFTAHISGHYYFTLKDENSSINCIMYANDTKKLRFMPESGMKVICRANATIYEKAGSLSLRILDIYDDGLGLITQKYEALKKKLSEEGYFDPAHKKQLVRYPFSIGLVAGNETDAKKDVYVTLKRRWPAASIYFYQSLVQGEKAADDIIRALSLADQQNHDAILLVRGGGSLEDLWCFNEERLVRFIYDMKTPVVTGIGHETDFTLCDFVADVRANTPTGAAEIVAPKISDVYQEISSKTDRLVNCYKSVFDSYEKRIRDILSYRIPALKNRLVESRQTDLAFTVQKLFRFPDSIKAKRFNTRYISGKIITRGSSIVTGSKYKLSVNCDKIKSSIYSGMKEKNLDLSSKVNLLNAYSPKSILERGYAIVTSKDKTVKDASQLDIDDIMNITLAKGRVKGKVVGKEEQQ